MTRVHAALRRGRAHRRKRQFCAVCTAVGDDYITARRAISRWRVEMRRISNHLGHISRAVVS